MISTEEQCISLRKETETFEQLIFQRHYRWEETDWFDKGKEERKQKPKGIESFIFIKEREIIN